MRLGSTLALVAGSWATLSTIPAAAQELDFAGQVRPRYEFRDPTGAAGSADVLISMRTRASLRARLERGVSLFVQLQDVRLWGEERSTLADFSADHLDLHQGYLEIAFGKGDGRARVGRQEVSFGGQRLVGAVDWTQQGRSFDGARLTLADGRGDLDLLGVRISDADAPGSDADHDFFGVYGVLDEVLGGALDLYALHDRRRGGGDLDRSTLGFRAHGAAGGITYRFEASYQTGSEGELDLAAFMLGGRVGATFADGRASATLWYDHLSGDDDPGDDEIGVFNTLYATNHKFYGFADLFLDIPSHTGGLGLQDLALKTSYRARNDLDLRVDLHAFRLAEELANGEARLGEEIDLTAIYRHSEGLTVQGGLSYVVQGDALAAIGRLSENATFVYLMLNAGF